MLIAAARRDAPHLPRLQWVAADAVIALQLRRRNEFLDTVRDGEVWRRTKAGAEKAGVAGLAVLLELGKAYGKEVLKEKLGIELP